MKKVFGTISDYSICFVNAIAKTGSYTEPKVFFGNFEVGITNSDDLECKFYSRQEPLAKKGDYQRAKFISICHVYPIWPYVYSLFTGLETYRQKNQLFNLREWDCPRKICAGRRRV